MPPTSPAGSRTLALVGCGAIAESFHLPALKALGRDRVSVILVDPSEARARKLGEAFGVDAWVSSHEALPDGVDGAILATPHHLHVPIALDLVGRGVGVLSEKPLGTSVAEVEALGEAAAASGAVVAVNQTRRFIPACIEIRRRIEEGHFGDLVSAELAEGDRFGWPAATPSMFGSRSGGRGVLLDIGVHALDLASWWFGPDGSVERYADDSFGGSEAAVQAGFRWSGAPVTLRLSWLAKQANRYVLQGTRETLVWSIYDLDRITVQPEGGAPRVERLSGAPGGFADLAPRVLEDFLSALDGTAPPAVGVDDALPALRLIETCYEERTRLDMPWHPFDLEVARV